MYSIPVLSNAKAAVADTYMYVYIVLHWYPLGHKLLYFLFINTAQEHMWESILPFSVRMSVLGAPTPVHGTQCQLWDMDRDETPCDVRQEIFSLFSFYPVDLHVYT